MIHVVPAILIAIFGVPYVLCVVRIIRRQRATWREWCERSQVSDEAFVRACGLPDDEFSRKLALATRTALAHSAGVPPVTIKADDPFRHNIWDSLDWLDVMFRVEKAAVVKFTGGGARDVLYGGRDGGNGTVVADLVRAVVASAQSDPAPRNAKRASPV